MQCFEDNKKSSSLCHIRLPHMENPQEIHSLFDKFAVAGYPIALPDKFHESLLVYCLIDIYHNNMVFYAVFWYTKRNGGEFIWQERKSIMLSSPIRNIKS